MTTYRSQSGERRFRVRYLNADREAKTMSVLSTDHVEALKYVHWLVGQGATVAYMSEE
jgi:hypothetical protein